MRTYNLFLEHVSLATSIDQNWEGDKINLMTMHAAKGLEFEVVFLPGWEEDFSTSKITRRKRRLCFRRRRRLAYVGITRAKQEAFISFAMRRVYHGDWVDALPSRFVGELPEKNIEKNEKQNFKDDTDFDFNQDIQIEFDDEYRSPGWERFKRKNKLIK